MKFRNLVTHGCAVLAGIALAVTFSNRNPSTDVKIETVDSTVGIPIRRTVREIVVRPRDLLRSMTKVPMESSERYTLKRDIYGDWAKRDSLGFLGYLDRRPWPGYIGTEGPFEILAKTQPEELLAYARRTGCTKAAETLVQEGDPYRVLEILGADGLARLPGDVLTDFVRRGEDADPQFHERLAVITDETTRKRAFQDVASRMEDAGRLEDLHALVTRYPESFDDSSTGGNFAVLLARDPREMERLDALPESLRAETAKAMISSFDDDEVSEDGRREILTSLASRGLLKSSGMEVFETIMERAEDMPPEGLEQWKSWAMGLPQDECMRPLRLASMAMWSIGSHAGPDQLANLPPGEMRDAATIGALASQLEQENSSQAIQLAGQIEDAELRTKFLQYLKLCETGDEPDEFDPFGFVESDESKDD